MASLFWRGLRTKAAAVAQALNGPARNATAMQRAMAFGAVQGFPRSNVWEELSHDTSWNYIAIHTVAKQWAQSSACVYDLAQQVNKSHAADAPAAQRTPIHDHPALKLLKRPNPVMSGKKLMYLIACHFRATGGYIIYEVRNDQGKPCELWPLPRAWCLYQTPTEQFPMGYYRVHNPRGMMGYWGVGQLAGGFYLDARDCIIDGYPNWLYPGEPQSPLTACAKIVDIMEQTDTTVHSLLMKAPRPTMIFSIDQQTPLDDAQIERMKASLSAYNAGPHNAGNSMFLQNVKLQPSNTPLADLDAVNIREQNKKNGLGIQGVPGIASGMREDVGSYSGDAATIHTFIELGIQPDLDYFAANLTSRWGRPEVYGTGFELEFSAKRMDDPILDQSWADKKAAAYKDNVVTVNQYLSSLKLPLQQGGDVVKADWDKMHQPLPEPGMPGADGQPDDDADGLDDLDLGLDLPDEDSPNEKRPERQSAFGLRNQLPQPSTNGVH